MALLCRYLEVFEGLSKAPLLMQYEMMHVYGAPFPRQSYKVALAAKPSRGASLEVFPLD
jgi:hypothetical protein